MALLAGLKCLLCYIPKLCVYIYIKERKKRISLSFFWPNLEVGPFFKSVQYSTELDSEDRI